METKTLLVFSCILAAASARPAAVTPSTSCSLSCSGRNFWSGYAAGKTYQYTFEQKVELKSPLNQQKAVLMQVSGKANFEVHSDCEMVLTVDIQETKSSKSPSESATLEVKSLPKALVDGLKAPLRFSFEDGRVNSMCPGSDETRASLNFKRGLLSQLHLSIDQPKQEATLRENDVLGNCWTVYKQLGNNKVEKTKDLSSCTNNFEVFPRQGVKLEAPETSAKWPTVVEGSLKCTIELDGVSTVIKENLCEENRVLDGSLGERGQGEIVRVETSLRFQQKLDSLASTLFEISDRSDLNHQHKTGDSCHDSKAWFEEDIFHSGNECLEKKLPASGVASTDFKTLAQQSFEALCTETAGNDMLNSSAAKYADAIKYMRGITTQADFDALFEWGKAYCASNSMFKTLFYSALPTVGTRYSVKVMLEQLKVSDSMNPDPALSNWLVNGIAMMPHPTPEILSDVLAYTKKAQEESLMPSKDAPLALAAVTGRYCTINTECQNNEVVDRVLTYFSDALGSNCSNLLSSGSDEVQSSAFAAVLSIGNIGRAKGGPSFLISCGENSDLAVVYGAFALRSLRRFPSLSSAELMRLGAIAGKRELDAELRIAAYQAMVRYTTASFWSDERVVNKLSQVMRNDTEDISVQRYIYSHLSQWIKKQSRLTDSYTVSTILREFERNFVSNSVMSGLQVSGYWSKQFNYPSTKSKIEFESDVIYSSASALPRFVNFNLTTESPLNGESVNLLELGIRMEGMEGTLELLFNMMQSKGPYRSRKRRQASEPELTEEQKQYQMKAFKQRLDIFARQRGMELMHTNFDEAVLSAVPAVLKSIDLQNTRGFAFDVLKDSKFNKELRAAGTQMETTISIPTISGFPILLKKEIHYLLNLPIKQELKMPSSLAMSLEFEVQPAASVYMARTVTVDSGFERAGLKSKTSGVTSMGVKMSVSGDFSNLANIHFSYKVDPIKKRQKLLEVKTDIQFLQHSGPTTVVESPVISELTPVTKKCFTPATVKLLGETLCLETNFERTYNPLSHVSQNPGSFQLYIDKDDTLGGYEATLRFKIEGDTVNFTAVLGDVSSTDRYAKVQLALTRTEGYRKIIIELANPVLPIKWESESRTNGAIDNINVGLKFGTTDYVFRGQRSVETDGSTKLAGDFYRQDKERQKLTIVTQFQSFGSLPLFQFNFSIANTDNDKLSISHLSKYEPGNFQLSFLASHEKADSVLTSIKSRLECTRVSGERQTATLVYNTDVTNKNGKNFLHTFTARVDRNPKEASGKYESTVKVIHKFNYGVTRQRSALDVEINLNLEETIQPSQLYKAIGTGSVQYGSKTERKTATLSNLRFILGEDDVVDEHFNTKTFLLEYATDVDGSQSEALVALQVLPLANWRLDNQCVYLNLKASKTTGADSQRHAFELRHTSGYSGADSTRAIVFMQVAKMVYSNRALLDFEHKFYSIPTSAPSKYVFGHHLNVTAYDAQAFLLKNEYSLEMAAADGNSVYGVVTLVSVNQATRLKANQSLSIRSDGSSFKYQLTYERGQSTGSVAWSMQEYNMEKRRKSFEEITSYINRRTRESFNLIKFLGLVKDFIYQIKSENRFQLETSSMSIQMTNYVDMTVTNGVMLNISRVIRSQGLSYVGELRLHKEIDPSTEMYRRVYKINLKNDDWEKQFTSEVVFKSSPKPKLSISLAKESLTGSQNQDFTLTTVVQFSPEHSREGQIGVEFNVTNVYKNSAPCSSSLSIVVDTTPWKYINPALNISYALESSIGALKVSYNLGVIKSEVGRVIGLRNVKSFTSSLAITNSIAAIPFSSYEGISELSTSAAQPFNLLFKKTLNDKDLINIQTRLNSDSLYIGVKSDKLPLKEASYSAKYSLESDGFIAYLSEIQFRILSWDLKLKDDGRFKVTGSNQKSLFSVVYSGNLEITGLEAVIGKSISMDRLDYNGKLEAKTTGEFDTNMEFIKVQGTTSESVGLVSAKLNYWPFEISSQIKTPLWNVDHYGFNISAGPKAPGNGYRFKAWIASPAKQSALTYWHTYATGETFEFDSEAKLTSDHLMPSSEGIKSTLKVTGSSIYDYTYSMNLTTPFPVVQRTQTDVVWNGDKQAIGFTLTSNDVQTKVIEFIRLVRTNADGARLINTTFSINSILPQATFVRNLAWTVDAVMGPDYIIVASFSMNNVRYAAVDLVYVKSGNTYPQQSGLSVPGANMGFDVRTYTQDAIGFQFYLLRTGDDTNGQWKMKYSSGDSLIETTTTIANGRVTAGSGTVLGQSITFSSPSENSIEVTAASADGTNTITWTVNKENDVVKNLQLRFTVGSQASCISYSKEGQQIDIRYGSCDTPNTIKITRQVSNFWEITRAVVRVTIEHNTVPDANAVFYVLPGFSFPIVTSQTPFNFLFDVNNVEKKGNMSLTSSAGAFEFGQSYDMSNFPRAMQYRRVLTYGSGRDRQVLTTIINYDTAAMTLDVQSEMANVYKLVASTTAFSLEANGLFTTGVEYTSDAATGKQMIEFKGEWRPLTGSEPCFLRIWRQNIDGGSKYAVQFQQHTGKDISIVSDVTNYKYTSTEFGMDVSTTLSSTLIESLRSVSSVMKVSFLQDPTNKNYTINYQESFSAGGVVYYEIESLFKGQQRQFPSTFRIAAVRGYIEADFSYNFNPEYDAASYLRWSLDKFGDSRNSYLAEYRSKDVSAHVGKFWRDFSFEASSPTRQFYLSESCKQLENGTVQTEIQAYLNKRNMEGFTAIFGQDFTVPNVYRRSLQLTLPTRKIGYERVMKTEGIKLEYNITAFWDMHTSLEKKVTIEFTREKENRDTGYYYYHKLGMTAPFLKNKVTKEMRIERAGDNLQISMVHGQESNDQVTVMINVLDSADQRQYITQREVNISFAQLKGDVKANARIVIKSQRTRPSYVLNANYLTEVNIYATVPSKSIDSHVRIRSIPLEEFTFACNHGATFSYLYSQGFEQSRLSLFVSNSNKEAGQLTVTCDKAKSVWEATLDTGTGYMNPKSELSFPIYAPTKVRVKATAGLKNKKSGRKIYFSVVNGEMETDSSLKLWKPETVPADIDFFFVGAKLNEDNTLGYASHWRIRRETKKSPFTVAKEVLIDPWAKASNLPISIETINSLWRPVMRSHAENIDTDVVLDMLTSVSSNDIDSLKRWAAKARENNEFMSNTIAKAITSAFYIFKGGVETWASMVRTSQYSNPLPAIDSGIRYLIGGLFDSATRALNKIPVEQIWSSTLAMTKYVTDNLSAYFTAYVERLDNRIRDRLSALTGGTGTSVLSIVYNAIASVYPLDRAYEKFSLVSQEYYNCIQTAAAELLSQFGIVVQPILVNTLGALPKVYDFFDNLSYERTQWRGYINDLFDVIKEDSTSNIERQMTGQTAYSQNLAQSLGLFLEGSVGRAIKQFFNTDANVVRVWRLNCDQACLDSGSFAAINGSVYLPFPASAVIPDAKGEDDLSLPYYYQFMPWWDKLLFRFSFALQKVVGQIASEKSIGGIIKTIISPNHQMAVAHKDYISTFSRKTLLNLSPCRYLLAHDFLSGDFSIYQTYTWNGVRRQRGDLLIRFGSRKIVITSSNSITLDGEELSSGTTKELSNPKFSVYSYGNKPYYVNAYISTELRQVVNVYCDTERCRVETHPLYHGRLNGAFGSNDGNPANDFHGSSASEHMRFWTAGMCVMAAPSK